MNLNRPGPASDSFETTACKLSWSVALLVGHWCSTFWLCGPDPSWSQSLGLLAWPRRLNLAAGVTTQFLATKLSCMLDLAAAWPHVPTHSHMPDPAAKQPYVSVCGTMTSGPQGTPWVCEFGSKGTVAGSINYHRKLQNATITPALPLLLHYQIPRLVRILAG